jgi:IS5 family transposase
MVLRVQQVLHQTRERVVRGNTQAANKIFSVFEAHTELIRKGKTNEPNEFGQLILVQGLKNQVVTHYQVCEQRRADSTLLLPALEKHVEIFGHAPTAMAADTGFFSAANEAIAEEKGVRQVSIPSHATKSKARKERQKKLWFKELPKWRTGCEGRISVLKRRHGLAIPLQRRRNEALGGLEARGRSRKTPLTGVRGSVDSARYRAATVRERFLPRAAWESSPTISFRSGHNWPSKHSSDVFSL